MNSRFEGTAPLLFIRHGETDWNAEGRLQGQRDIPLNDKGRSQARRNGAALAEKISEIASFDFVASPLGRARETMEIIRASLGLDPKAYRLEERLQETSFGEWEGSTFEELSTRNPELIAERESDRFEFVPPGGESYRNLSDRVGPWLTNLERPTMAVAHGGVGRVIRGRLLAVDRIEAVSRSFRQDRAFHWLDGAETII